MKKNDGFRIEYGTPKDFKNKEAVTKRCLEIANATKFPTDYEDVYEHLFGNDDAELFVVMDKNDVIYGYATCDNIAEHSNTYLHGIMIHPDVQEMGFSMSLVEEIVKKDKNLFFTARTHNPRVYEMMSTVAFNNLIFPSLNGNAVPEKVFGVIASHEATKNADSDLIVRDAYPDEKVMQTVTNNSILKIFEKLNPRDAQVIVVCTKNPD